MRWVLAAVAGLSGCVPFTAPESLDYEAPRVADRGEGVLRVVSWNIETVGEPGTLEYDAALDILDRLSPDVVALNEIADSEDAGYAEWLAIDAGFDHVIIGDSVGFGADRNAILSMHPLENAVGLEAPDLSGDPDANDITRSFVKATVVTSGGELDVVSMHWKSGLFGDDEAEFRRVLEAHRAIEAMTPGQPTLLTGDFNDDIQDSSDFPATFTSLPFGLPSSFWLGADLWDTLNGPGLPNDVFLPLLEADLVIPDIRQRSGTDATRPTSNRRLDYIVHTQDIDVRGTETFDCNDQDRPGGVELYGSRISNDACEDAADHLAVVMDLVLPEPVGGNPGPDPDPDPDPVPTAGDLVITELLPNPDACSDSDGEWVELHNASDLVYALDGLVLEDASGNTGVVASIDGDAEIGPGETVVLGRGDAPCGVSDALTYGAGLSLNNGGDTVTLWFDDLALDTVAYPGSAADPDVSWVVEGDTGCEAVPTPGVPNEACP